MKKVIVMLCGLSIFNFLTAQNMEVYKNGFAGLSPGWSSNYFSQTDVNGSRFFYNGWATGSVTNNTNQTFSGGYLFIFDKLEQSLYTKSTNADSNITLLIDRNQISNFTINTDRPHQFLPAENYRPVHKHSFLEILVKNDSAFTFLKLVTTKFVRADSHNMLKAINGDTKSSYVDDVLYFVSYRKGALQKVNLTEKSFKSALSNSELKVENYISQNEKHTKNEQFYIDLVQAANN